MHSLPYKEYFGGVALQVGGGVAPQVFESMGLRAIMID